MIEVLLIIVATVILSIKGFNDRLFFEKYKFNIRNIQNKEYIRMFSSGFLHVDYTHLFFNMFTLYMFSNILLEVFGILYFVIYFMSMFTGSLFTLYLHRNEPRYSAVGASGAVTGVVYTAIILYPQMSLYLFLIPIPIPAYMFGIGYLLFSLYGMTKLNDGIGHTAHFGGAFGGILSMFLFGMSYVVTNYQMVILLLLPFLLLIVNRVRNKNI